MLSCKLEHQPSEVPSFARHCSEQSLHSQTVQLKPMRAMVCISRNQVWNAKIFLCLFNKDLVVNSKETGGAGGGGQKLFCWVLLPANTFSTQKVEMTNSFAYIALASRYIMSRLVTKALKNREQQPACIASEHLEILPHADRMINSSELQVLLHNTWGKKRKNFSPKF